MNAAVRDAGYRARTKKTAERLTTKLELFRPADPERLVQRAFNLFMRIQSLHEKDAEVERGLLPQDEAGRINALRRYNILDTPPDGTFDRVTRLAARLLNVPIAIVSLVDTDRIWFKSRYGLDVSQIERYPGLCSSAITTYEPWIVSDARGDPRTFSHPLVVGDFGLRFYAGVPLTTKDGYNMGTLCVIDREPREIEAADIATLKDLAAVVIDEMELRFANRQSARMKEVLRGRAFEGSKQARRLMQQRQEAERALRESEERYRSLIELSSDWHWEQDANGRFTSIVAAGGNNCRFDYGACLGKTLGEVPGITMSEEDWSKHTAALEAHSAFHDLTLRWNGDNGKAYFACISGRPIFSEGNRFVGFRGIARDITATKIAQDELACSHAALRQLSNALQSVREVERKRLACELHDDLAQLLATSRMDLALLRREVQQSSSSSQKFERLDQLLGSSIVALRRIATDLRPSALDEGGLYFALKSVIRNFSKNEGIACLLIADEGELVLDEMRSTAIFRVIQESLANISRHAKAKNVTVLLQRDGGDLRVRIKDDGRGISEQDMQKEKAFGLLGMRERVWQMKGKIEISGKHGEGTTVEIAMPVAG